MALLYKYTRPSIMYTKWGFCFVLCHGWGFMPGHVCEWDGWYQFPAFVASALPTKANCPIIWDSLSLCQRQVVMCVYTIHWVKDQHTNRVSISVAHKRERRTNGNVYKLYCSLCYTNKKRDEEFVPIFKGLFLFWSWIFSPKNNAVGQFPSLLKS